MTKQRFRPGRDTPDEGAHRGIPILAERDWHQTATAIAEDVRQGCRDAHWRAGAPFRCLGIIVSVCSVSEQFSEHERVSAENGQFRKGTLRGCCGV